VAYLKVVAVCLLLTGCQLFSGFGADHSSVRVDHACDVTVDQRALTAGKDDADVVESVTISPDCTTKIDFKQDVGQ